MRVWLFFLVLFPLVAGATPNFVLKDVAGKSHNVNEYIGKGKWTVVTLWAHDCPICKQEIYQMVFFHDEHRKKDATVLGVSIDGDNRAAAKRFIDDQGLNFPNLLIDPDQVGRFGAGELIGTPTYFIYTPTGKLTGKNIGPLTQKEVEAFIKSGGKKGLK